MSKGLRHIKENVEQVANRRLAQKDSGRGLGYWGASDYMSRKRQPAKKAEKKDS